jgi:hypothetical protein
MILEIAAGGSIQLQKSLELVQYRRDVCYALVKVLAIEV